MVRVRYSFGSRHTGRIANIKKQRGKYPDVMRDVVRISDIVLEVLDARYIEETRNLEVEADVIRQGKKLVYVLNKVDLVDRGKVKLPKDMRPFVFVSATEGRGVRDLKGKIKIEAKRILAKRKKEPQIYTDLHRFGKKGKGKNEGVVKDVRGMKRVHVGVIGYPNAGKSSVINMITKRGVAKTAKQAGFTKGMQKIRMSEGILILDTPGVIPELEYSTESGSFAKDVKVGARTYSDVKNPEDVVYYLMSAPEPVDADNVTKAEREKIDEAAANAAAIAKFYDIEDDGVNEMIEELGKKKGFLGKGGKVDVDRTARLVLRDWQLGEIG
jgi:hypothetical protein